MPDKHPADHSAGQDVAVTGLDKAEANLRLMPACKRTCFIPDSTLGTAIPACNRPAQLTSG
jgi:hypothetical protein